MSTHDDDKDGDNEVGYCRPPRRTQFKKGQSGNPRGRPRAAKSVGDIIEEVYFREITITENGKRRKVPLMKVILQQLGNGAAKGDLRHMDRVLKLLPFLQAAREAALAPDGRGSHADPEADIAVLEALADMFGSDPQQLFASVQGGIKDDRSKR